MIDNAIEAAAAGASNATLSLPSSVFLGQYNQIDTYRIEDSSVIIIKGDIADWFIHSQSNFFLQYPSLGIAVAILMQNWSIYF